MSRAARKRIELGPVDISHVICGRCRRTPALIATALAALALAACGEQREQEPAGAGSFAAEVRRTDAAGTTIAWYERGEGPPLLMLTGTGSTMGEWDPALLRLLAAERRLILLDYPGVGLSGPWRGRSFSSLAGSVAALLEAIGIERADVLGWSMGGFVAQRLAIEHPERVSALILAGTNPGGSRAVLGSPRAQALDSEPNPSDRDVLRLLYPRDRQAEGRDFLRRLVRASRSGEIPDDFRVPDATVAAQVAAEDPWLRSDRNHRELGALGTQVLAAAGRSDPVTPAANARRIAARAPDSRLLLLPGAHAFLFQERRAFVAAVDSFLAR